MSLSNRAATALSRAHMYLYRRWATDARRNLPFELVWRKAAEESAEFIHANLEHAVLHYDRVSLWKQVLRSLPKTGQLLEVGVFQGQSINMVADDLARRGDPRIVQGFDSFEGLEEDWSGEALPAGYFDQGGKLPSVRSNVRLHKGWVQDTLTPFMAGESDKTIALLHIDTDTYTPAKFTLDAARDFLVPGSIIVFDELIGYPNWQAHEYKALGECLKPEQYRFVAFTSRQAALQIL
jgi:hypothetical protein